MLTDTKENVMATPECSALDVTDSLESMYMTELNTLNVQIADTRDGPSKDSRLSRCSGSRIGLHLCMSHTDQEGRTPALMTRHTTTIT